MISPVARQKDYRPVSPVDGSKPTIPAPGGSAWRRAGAPGLPAVSATRRCRQSKRVAEIAENAGIDGNEVLECSPVTGKSLTEIADIPCKYFARETVRRFTVSLWGQSKRRFELRYPPSGRCVHAVAAKLGRKSLLTDSIGQADTPALTLLDVPQFKPATMFRRCSIVAKSALPPPAISR